MKSVAVIILAGGLSSRMGVPKKDLLIKNEKGESVTFLQRLCCELSFFEERYISINQKQKDIEVPEGYSLITDEYSEIGPIGAIYSGLKNIKSEYGFFVACDMPFYNKKEAERFLSRLENQDILIPKTDRLQPLAAIYSKSCLPKIKEQIESGDYRLREFMKFFTCETEEISNSEFILYENVNTMIDYLKINGEKL